MIMPSVGTPASSIISVLALGRFAACDPLTWACLSCATLLIDRPPCTASCPQADAAAVLSRDPCPLSQMVLLSLVQQLSADLTTSLAAKLAWIREAALQLNPKDPVLARHLRPVLEGVHTALAAAAARAVGPDAASCRLALHVVHSQMTS